MVTVFVESCSTPSVCVTCIIMNAVIIIIIIIIIICFWIMLLVLPQGISSRVLSCSICGPDLCVFYVFFGFGDRRGERERAG